MCFFSIFPGHLLLNTKKKKKKKKKDLPTYLPYFFWNRYRKQTIFFFRPKPLLSLCELHAKHVNIYT